MLSLSYIFFHLNYYLSVYLIFKARILNYNLFLNTSRDSLKLKYFLKADTEFIILLMFSSSRKVEIKVRLRVVGNLHSEKNTKYI